MISLENETKNDKLFSKINNHMYLGTYISTHYTLTIGDDKAYFEKNPGLFGCIWFCSQCGIPMFGKDNVQVDHIIPLAGLGINRTINTVAICPRCNREKSDKCGKYAVKGVIAKFFEATLFSIQKIVLQILVFILKILHGIVTGIARAVGTVFSLFSTEAKIIVIIIVALAILLIFI